MSLGMDIQRSLGRIEGKLDSLTETLKAHTADDAVNFIHLEKQQYQLQRVLWMAVGVITFLGISIPTAISYFK